ncbi:hypothetical protein I6A84_35440 [Frankia sp. CNm7]|uniref:DUF6458 domain-containing protein n=1 Tax=Frankia nepalensis TaxID=1836974 RepID=A0A937UTJ2_9ACTN|nr:DUF6458 family protein [Frankia nepalensis]MBL7495606.1 hypothetical protein [Frankia nepalensis]MBL7508852.1 hypothetical protein [Frankia nepalensis]MBL7523237.1 hypothetical protein [Frankia nepalensis]MBL7630076.1 hypothetical protein [Frankia nepalensis]
MGIGAGIFLMALGAILTFAVDVEISGLDIAVIGVVLMVAGAVGIILDVFLFAPRRRQRVVYQQQQRPAVRPDVEVYDEVATDRDPRFRRQVTTTDYRPMR